MPFKKGQSGNPKGRPKDGESFTNILDEYLKKEKKTEAKKWLAEQMVKYIEGGNGSVFIQAMDRYFGKVKEIIKHEGDPDNPQKVVIEIVRVGEDKKK